MDQQLVDYVKQARSSGMTDEQIKQSLIAAGWDKNVIDGLFPQTNDMPLTTITGGEDQTAFIKKWSWSGFLLYWIYFLASRLYKKGILYFLGYLSPS